MTVERGEREGYILDLLAKDGSLSVAALSKDLGVSEVTIRASLKSMEERGLLARTWGGAKANTLTDVLERVRVQGEEKERIAATAAELVQDGDRIMIEAGTTTAMIVRHLAGRSGVQIVTNSTLVFNYARLNTALEVILTGGQYHRESESLVGPVALASIRRFNARIAFVGTDGFTSDRGMTTQFAEGAEVIEAMNERSEETWLLADSSKYGRAGFVSVLDLTELNGIITDSGLAAGSVDVLKQIAPTVRVV
ncbi:MAG: DeoR/GlpR family DNA-binding transcription regulator [Actinobacteria bacterium]|nr:DeoR/GlpR family DNA-binding transcription regulator [Actinomycetota bacterium]